jgi:hypothetical protein
MVNFMPRSLYFWGKGPLLPFDRRLVGPRAGLSKAVLFIVKLAFNQINTFGTKLLLYKFIVYKLAKNDATLSHFDT